MTLTYEDRMSRVKFEGADHLCPDEYHVYMYHGKFDGYHSRMCTLVMYLDRGVVYVIKTS
jgi:hypothetical protein